MAEPISPSKDFDFEQWRQLHAADPHAFERRRAAAIEAAISTAPAGMQARLRGVQFRMDMERARAGSDLSACLKAHTMMWDSLIRLRDALARLSAIDSAPGGQSSLLSEKSPPPTAQVIAFPRGAGRESD